MCPSSGWDGIVTTSALPIALGAARDYQIEQSGCMFRLCDADRPIGWIRREIQHVKPIWTVSGRRAATSGKGNLGAGDHPLRAREQLIPTGKLRQAPARLSSACTGLRGPRVGASGSAPSRPRSAGVSNRNANSRFVTTYWRSSSGSQLKHHIGGLRGPARRLSESNRATLANSFTGSPPDVSFLQLI